MTEKKPLILIRDTPNPERSPRKGDLSGVASGEESIESLRAQRLPTLISTYIQNYGSGLADYVNPAAAIQPSPTVKPRPRRPSPTFQHAVGVACYYNPEAVENLETPADDKENPYLEQFHQLLLTKLLPLRTYGHTLFPDSTVPLSVINAQTIMSFANVDVELDTKRFPTRRYRKANTIVRRARKHLDARCRRLDQADLAVRAVVYTQLMNTLDTQISLTKAHIKAQRGRNVYDVDNMTNEQMRRMLSITHSIAEDFFDDDPDFMEDHGIEDVEMLDDLIIEALSHEKPLLIGDLLTRLCNDEDDAAIRLLVKSYLSMSSEEDALHDIAAEITEIVENIPANHDFERHLHSKTAELNRMLHHDHVVLPFIRPESSSASMHP